ncbi:MAG: ABC transporter substrate-binding protein [Candidatus Peregrinibacteria bacterium]|nr:ABC transporter substrate-binding protein [Candidatus Peregrinibacteria bacterium]
MRKKYLLTLLSIGALLVIAGCTGGDTSSVSGEPEENVITIGGIQPLTGDGASYGIEMQRVAEIALADVNEAWTEEGMELVIQWEDGGCNGNDASTAAQKLVDVNKVEVIFGGFCSSETLAAAPITEEAGVILLSGGSSSPDITDAGDYVFRTWPSDAFQGSILAKLANELGYTTVAIISEQQDYTLGISTVFTEEFEALGGTVIEETFLSEDTDFKTQLTKLNNEGADAIFINAQTPIKGEVIIKQIQELGIDGPFLLNDGVGTNTEVLTSYSEFLEGAYTATVQIDENADEMIQLQTTYNELYGEDLTSTVYAASTYDAVWILANALTEVGNDADAIRDYLNTLEGYNGLMGNISFDENGDPLSGHSIFMIVEGALVVQ